LPAEHTICAPACGPEHEAGRSRRAVVPHDKFIQSTESCNAHGACEGCVLVWFPCITMKAGASVYPSPQPEVNPMVLL